VAEELARAGLRRTRWWTDDAGDFGLSLAVK
jgi:L-histidine Nalpha-methyltransferase